LSFSTLPSLTGTLKSTPHQHALALEVEVSMKSLAMVLALIFLAYEKRAAQRAAPPGNPG